MISVCVPVYRFFVLPQDQGLLRTIRPGEEGSLQTLYQQLQASGLEFELRVYEDASPPPYPATNQLIANLGPEVVYKLLPKNLGRAKIRNLLAQEARYPQLLFLDADSGIPTGFVQAYLPYLDPRRFPVVQGGRTYPARAQLAANYWLHQRYGLQRERLDPNATGDDLYRGFQTNNFLVSRDLLLTHPFPSDFSGYGHEDTLWGWQLKARQVPVFRIDNPVIHLGLEAADVFLRKQEEAVVNLKQLEQQQPNLPSRLGDFARRWAWCKPIISPIVRQLGPFAKRQLLKGRPLYWLDVLKLNWYWRNS
ncbi:MAG: glycosyltransferase [Bacteroidota bacterium]